MLLGGLLCRENKYSVVYKDMITLIYYSFQRFIKALAISGSKVTREQKRSEKLILALLPPVVAERLIGHKVRKI